MKILQYDGPNLYLNDRFLLEKCVTYSKNVSHPTFLLDDSGSCAFHMLLNFSFYYRWLAS